MHQPRQNPQHLRNLLQQRRKNLQQLEMQEAKHGNQAPLALLNAIEDERAAIIELEAQIEQEEAAIASTLEPEVQSALPTKHHGDLASLVTLLTALYSGSLSHLEGQSRVSQEAALAPLLDALLSKYAGSEGVRVTLHTGSAQGDIQISLARDGADRNLIQITIPVTGGFGATYYQYRAGAEPPPVADIAAGAQRVELPLNHVPDVAQLPPRSHMPVYRNPQFVGRQEDLRAIAAALTAAADKIGAPVPTVAITGMGGVGKTQLACEFVYRYGQFFSGGVFWVSFAEANGIRGRVAACGAAMGLAHNYGRLSLEKQVKLVRDAWKSPVPQLLVFDNCEDPDLLAEWRPLEGGARVIVTSRLANWDSMPGVAQRPLRVLSRSESMALIGAFRPDLRVDGPGLDAVCAALGDLPLALHLSGSYLRECGSTFGAADYLDDLASMALLEHESQREDEQINAPAAHLLRVGRSFALSYKLLDPLVGRDRLALALLQRASYFAQAEPIAKVRLLATLPPDAKFPRASQSQAVERLVALGLLEMVDERHVRMHRLLAMFVQQRDTDPAARLAVSQHLRGVAANASVPIASRRTAAFQLLRIGGLAGSDPIATAELLACLDLVARFVVAAANHHSLIEAITAHLNDTTTAATPRQSVQLLVYRAMLWGSLSEIEDEQTAARLQAASDDYASARALNEAIRQPGEIRPEDWRTEARINLGDANLIMRQVEQLPDPADEETKRLSLKRAEELYLQAADAARSYEQDIVLLVTVYNELSYTYACLEDWEKAKLHYEQALEIISRSKNHIDAQAYARQSALVLETASQVHLAKGTKQPEGRYSAQALQDYIVAYDLTQQEIALLQQSSQDMKSLVLAYCNAGDCLREMQRCPGCPIPEPLDEAYAYWKSAQDLAHRLGMLEWERVIGRRITQLREEHGIGRHSM